MPVLVHCSHGWDRTAQVTAFAQLLLDPFYRTFDGFKVLIEKEWCSFGHPFQLRCAHGDSLTHSRAYSLLLTHSLTHSLAHLLTHWLTYSLLLAHSYSPTYLLTYLLTGQDKSSRQDDQTSPVFLQFLDCVWQLIHQFPHYFEYNSRYLISIADHIYSCRFGTFLFNSDYERDTCNARQRTLDIWTYLHYNRYLLTHSLTHLTIYLLTHSPT